MTVSPLKHGHQPTTFNAQTNAPTSDHTLMEMLLIHRIQNNMLHAGKDLRSDVLPV